MIFGLKFTPPWKKTLGTGEVAKEQGEVKKSPTSIKLTWDEYRKSPDFLALTAFYNDCIDEVNLLGYSWAPSLRTWLHEVMQGKTHKETTGKLCPDAKAFLTTVRQADKSSHCSLKDPDFIDQVPVSYRNHHDDVHNNIALVCHHRNAPGGDYVTIAVPYRSSMVNGGGPYCSVMTYHCDDDMEKACDKLRSLHPNLTQIKVESWALSNFKMYNFTPIKKREVKKDRVWRGLDGNFYKWIGKNKSVALGTNATILVETYSGTHAENIMDIDDKERPVIVAPKNAQSLLDKSIVVSQIKLVRKYRDEGIAVSLINDNTGIVSPTFWDGDVLKHTDGSVVEKLGIDWFVYKTFDLNISGHRNIIERLKASGVDIDVYDGTKPENSVKDEKDIFESKPVDNLWVVIAENAKQSPEAFNGGSKTIDDAVLNYLSFRIRENDPDGHSLLEQLNNYLPKGDVHERESEDSMG